jgi:EAL domain-containing protein (putative c-di-GMP-specific phosphodiesterase class I)
MQAGYDTQTCCDSRQALALIETGAFEAIVSDISMPDLNGIELLKIVRRSNHDLPVLLVTGDPNLQTAINALDYGAFKYLLKPVTEEQLVRTVRRAVRVYRLATLKRTALATLGTGLGEASDRAGLEASLERALDSLWPAFQPIVAVCDQSLFGYEALLRSNEPSLPHPGAVLDAAERLDQVHRVGRAMRQRATLQLPDSAQYHLFLNLHPSDLMDPMLLDPAAPHVKMADRIVLEVTERVSLDSIVDVRRRVQQLREVGFRIAVDDLGAGYAGLASFVQLEPDLVKLDMSLTRGVDSNATKQRLVRSMTQVCRDMGLLIVAEGVETREERDTLAELGCDLLQGYLFGRPERDLRSVIW